MVLGKVTNQLIEKFMSEICKLENKQRIKKQLLTPMASYIEGYLKPYFLTLLIVLLVLVALLLFNIKLLLSLKNKIS